MLLLLRKNNTNKSEIQADKTYFQVGIYLRELQNKHNTKGKFFVNRQNTGNSSHSV